MFTQTQLLVLTNEISLMNAPSRGHALGSAWAKSLWICWDQESL